MQGKKVCITGGAGFIGSHVAKQCLLEGAEVRIIDNLSTGRVENIAHIKERITFIEGDVCDQKLLEETFTGVDYVIHLAAFVSVPLSITHPIESNEVNVDGSLAVFLSASKCGVKRVVYASSSAVYGDVEEMPISEDQILKPLSPYALQKMTTEQYASLFRKYFGLETVGLRYFNVFGPHQNPDSDYAAVVPLFISRAKAGKEITIFGDGSATRDFVYVEDVARANILACVTDDANGEVFNIASGSETTIGDLAKSIIEISGKQSQIVHAEKREGDIEHSVADITKAKEVLKFTPTTTLQEGLHILSNS